MDGRHTTSKCVIVRANRAKLDGGHKVQVTCPVWFELSIYLLVSGYISALGNVRTELPENGQTLT